MHGRNSPAIDGTTGRFSRIRCGENRMRTIVQDLKYAVRVMAGNRTFTAAAIACLALGIGATTAIFSVAYAVLLKPLPYRNPEQLVRLYTEWPSWPKGALTRFWTSPPEFDDLKRELASYQALEAWSTGGANLAGGGAQEPMRVNATQVTGGLMGALGTAPMHGRAIAPSDDQPGITRVAILSYSLFQRAFGGDRGVIGRTVQVNGANATVVGVMPPEFRFPPGEADPTELWLPAQLGPPNPQRRGSHFLYVLGRLKDGISVEQARQELSRYVNMKGETAGNTNHQFNPKTHTLVAHGLHDEVAGPVKSAVWMLVGAVGFVLLIACVNAANLLLARAEARQREIAVRQAIGAGTGRLLRQFLTEGVLLSGAGAIAGIILAALGLRILVTAGSNSIPRAAEIGLNGPVLAATVLITLLTGVLFGLAPLLHLASKDVHESLKAAAGRTTAGTSSAWFRNGMVVTELALALVLLIGTGLMVRAFWKLLAVDGGFNPANVITMRIVLPATTYTDSTKTTAFWQGLEQRVRSLPGIEAVAIADDLAPTMQLDANDTFIENFVQREGGPIQNIDYWTIVGHQYFEALKIRLIEGRTFDERDGPGSNFVVMVSKTMADTYWPGQSAVGRRVRPPFGPGGDGPWFTVVGVVNDVKNGGLDKPSGTELYFAHAQLSGTQFALRGVTLLARTKGDPLAAASGIRSQIREMDAALPVSRVRSMEQVLETAQARPRFLTLLLSIFSFVAIGLAAVGVYGVISYSVARRTNEFGIRLALGAGAGDLLGRALLLTRFLKELLFGISAVDPLTFAAMGAALLAVTALACLAPARRATKVDPIIALRNE
jgi:putative ABC transport system permease protein